MKNSARSLSAGLFGQTGPDTLPLKSWLANGVLALAVIQLGLALRTTASSRAWGLDNFSLPSLQLGARSCR